MLFRPFRLNVWVPVVSMLVVMPFVLFAISNLEWKIARDAKYWTTFSKAFWYTYGTFLNESFTRVLQCKRAWAIR